MAIIEISGAAATIAASAVTGVVAVVTVLLTNRGNNARFSSQLAHDRELAKTELMRDKGEELYELASAWQQNFATRCVSLQAVMRGQLTYNEALDLQKDGITASKQYRIRLLVQAYFPEQLTKLDEIIGKVETVSKLSALHRHAYQRDLESSASFLKPFTDANLALCNSIDEFKETIASRVGAL